MTLDPETRPELAAADQPDAVLSSETTRAASEGAVGNSPPFRRELRPRQVRREVNGLLLLDKPLGLSSNDALQDVKRLFRAEKAGHTGTLDPLASGLLPICFGAATKFSQVSLEADKSYAAILRLGQRTVGGDREGEVIEERPVQVTREQLVAACAQFVGRIRQLPPMHSALKVAGKPLYAYARAGQSVERQPREVTIHRIDMLAWDAQSLEMTIAVSCTKGTYIRTLAEDIGEVLGCGAHLAALRRTLSGPLTLDGAVTIDQLREMDEAGRDALLLSPDRLLADWPVLRLSHADAARFLQGLRRRISQPDTPAVRVYGPEPAAFLGSGHITAGELIADRLLSPFEVQALLNC